MRKVFGVALLLATTTLPSLAFATSYECYRYVNGSPTGGWIKVEASSKDEATRIALQRFRELGGQVDSANCH